jgi:hypothetical protein
LSAVAPGYVLAEFLFFQLVSDAFELKVMGTVDKWNAMAAKAQGFYGNPLSGFGP